MTFSRSASASLRNLVVSAVLVAGAQAAEQPKTDVNKKEPPKPAAPKNPAKELSDAELGELMKTMELLKNLDLLRHADVLRDLDTVEKLAKQDKKTPAKTDAKK